MGWTQNVYSEMITDVGWDEQQGLVVTFKKGGAVWSYPAVSEGLAQSLANAPSVGKMFHEEIRNNPAYPGSRVG